MNLHRRDSRGVALAIAVVLTAILIALSFTILDLTNKNFNASKEAMSASDALQMTDAGASIALDMLKLYALDETLTEPDYFNSGADTNDDGIPDVPRNIIRVDISDDEYYLVEILDDGDPDNTAQNGEFKIIRSTGYKDGYTKTVEMTVQTEAEEIDPLFESAIYSGNSSGADFAFELGGSGAQMDTVTGNIYVDGRIDIDRTAGANNDSYDEFSRTFGADEDYTVAGQTVNIKSDGERRIMATGGVVDNDTLETLDVTEEVNPDWSADDKIDDYEPSAAVPFTKESIENLMDAHPEYVVNVNAEFAANEMPAKNATYSSTNSTYFNSSTERSNYWTYYRDYVINNVNNPAHIFTHGAQYSTGTGGYGATADPTIASGSWVSSSSPPAKLGSTNKGYNTYHIKDPFEVGSNGRMPGGTTAATGGKISITKQGGGQDGSVASEGNMKIYYIEGDLWIHDANAYNMTIQHKNASDGQIVNDGLKVAFVVVGNIYFSDNVFWNYDGSAQTDPERANPLTQDDFFMFMALKKDGDDEGDTSGNILLGDPQFGTVEELDAMLYAEHDFKENNITASGSSQFVINGNMTAGNHVDINRDSGSTHSKMMVNYESRLVDASYKEGFMNSMAPWMQQLLTRQSDVNTERNFGIVSWRVYPAGYVDPEGEGVTVWTREQAIADIVENNAYVGE